MGLQLQDYAYKGKGKGVRRRRRGRWRVKKRGKKGGKGSAHLTEWASDLIEWSNPFDAGNGWAIAEPTIDVETGYPMAECPDGNLYEFVWMDDPVYSDSSGPSSYMGTQQPTQPQLPYNANVWNVGHGWFGHAEETIDYGFRVDFNGRSIPSILPPCESLEDAKGIFGQNMSWLSWKYFINLEDHPTYVVLDLGCTRSMGSMSSVKAFVNAGKTHGITAKWRRVNTLMSFANSQST